MTYAEALRNAIERVEAGPIRKIEADHVKTVVNRLKEMLHIELDNEERTNANLAEAEELGQNIVESLGLMKDHHCPNKRKLH